MCKISVVTSVYNCEKYIGDTLLQKTVTTDFLEKKTALDKYALTQKPGRYKVQYKIPSLTLMSGDYVIDVGIFNSEGIVNLDYKSSCRSFSVTNAYFSEGTFYLEHEWHLLEGEQ